MLENKIQKVISLCEKHWIKYEKDCSGYVKAVASEIGITITGQANDIVDQLNDQGWKLCKDGVDARQKAICKAGQALHKHACPSFCLLLLPNRIQPRRQQLRRVQSHYRV